VTYTIAHMDFTINSKTYNEVRFLL